MKLRLEDKLKAIELRLQGKTYKQIQSEIPNLSKSTLSGWLKNLQLTKEQERQLKRNIQKSCYNARVKAAWTKRKKKENRVRKIILSAEKEYHVLKKNPLFLIGLALYWAEGTKKQQSFQFTNSDPSTIKIMLQWLEKFCGISKSEVKIRVYIHKVYAYEHCEAFWSKITGIPINKFQKTIYKPTPHKVKKNLHYKGCVQLRVLKTELFWKVVGWIQALIKDFQ